MLNTPSPSEPPVSSPVTGQARYFEYTAAVNPLEARLISRVPPRDFPPSLYAEGGTRVVPLDLSAELGCPGPATSPGLCANFLRIRPGEELALAPNATSQVFYVMGGSGRVQQGGTRFLFEGGDFLALPGGSTAVLTADSLATLYYVHDAPLLNYLGVTGVEARFSPTLYPAARARAELRRVEEDANSARRNRISILLGNSNFPQTRTITHVLWTMSGVVLPHSVQKPHRHQSIALDFTASCAPGCYTLLGSRLDDAGHIVNPTRVDWTTGMAFVTPPGLWHAHFNESGEKAYVIPIQDAGLQSYLRTLDIRFSL
ncbi:MAG: hypothetical protein ABW123_07315 [Cystobacter sp.]